MTANLYRISLIVAYVCLALMVGKCRGELVTFRFKGTVTQVDASLFPPGGQQTWPDVGAPFRGTYSFESTTTGSTADPYSEIYNSFAPAEVRVQVGDFSFTGTQTAVGVYDAFLLSPPQEIYQAGSCCSNLVLTSPPNLSEVLNYNNFQLTIRGDTDLLDGLVLPLAPPSLTNAIEASLELWLNNGENTVPAPYVLILGRLESLTLVPEPSGVILLGIGVCVAGVLVKRTLRVA